MIVALVNLMTFLVFFLSAVAYASMPASRLILAPQLKALASVTDLFKFWVSLLYFVYVILVVMLAQYSGLVALTTDIAGATTTAWLYWVTTVAGHLWTVILIMLELAMRCWTGRADDLLGPAALCQSNQVVWAMFSVASSHVALLWSGASAPAA